MLDQWLFRIAKSPLMGRLVGNAFRFCGWAIPVKKVGGGREIIAFRHPQPAYENHVILSPKKAIKDLQQMASDDLDAYFMKVWETAMDIRAAHPEYRDAFTLVANGGKRQEVQQVHFHLFSHHDMVSEYAAPEQPENVFYRDEDSCVFAHPAPDWDIHFVTRPTRSEADPSAYFRSVLHSIDRLDAAFHIVEKGYSLVCQYRHQDSEQACPIFHIISGSKRKKAA